MRAAITWGPAMNITGDSDISTIGDLEYAYRFEATSGATGDLTINGVTFTSISGSTSVAAPNTHTDFVFAPMNVSPVLSTNHQFGNGRSVGVSTSPTMTSSYVSFLGGYIFAGGANSSGVTGRRNGYTMTLNGLEVGKEYSIQAWYNDSRSGTGNRRGAIQDGGPAIDYNVSAASVNGGLGQYAIGTFTASGTTESFTFIAFADENVGAQLNGFQLRLIPEPASTMLAGFGAIVLGLRRRR